MPPVRTRQIHATIALAAFGCLVAQAAPAFAQGFGIGPRIAWVTPNSDANIDVDVDTMRYFGGQIRMLSSRFGFEVSLDRHSESLEVINQKITETPIQTSLLLRLATGRVSPFLLGGPGWYKRSVEPLDGAGDSVSTTEFGWHAGIGLEVLANRHFGVHGDYRYTFLDFGHDDNEDRGLIGGLLPGHRGSMWTLGFTVYF
jgi:Outer membrane protein beta-barrel domain